MSSNTKVIPLQTAPLSNGARTQRENALLHQQKMNQNQNALNNKHGGERKRKKGRKMYGGDHVVPSFDSSGPPVGAGGQTATGASVAGNTTSLQQGANAVCDTCATTPSASVCTTPQCAPPASGGGKKRKARRTKKKRGGNKPWGCMSGGKKKTRGKRRHAKKKTRKRKNKRKRKTKKTFFF